MKKIILINKKEGETPLQALGRFRKSNPQYKNEKMTYAGRLDPLVSGILLLLAGDLRYEKEKYLKLPKEYDFTVLFGFATDTYDILGKVQHSRILKNVGTSDLEKEIKKNLKFFRGKFRQKYPMYSSKPVAGKPLFAHARAGSPVESPERDVRVFNLKYLGMRKLSRKRLLENIESRVSKVKGDFRQKEILKIWKKKLGQTPEDFFIADFHIKCSSGTYVRGVADSLGEKIGVPALALKIKRTKIGNWAL